MPIPYWAGHYIGLPFKEHGRNIKGLDCWGLVRCVFIEQFKIPLPSYAYEYQHCRAVADISALVSRESQKWKKIDFGQENQGDVIVLRLRGQPMHVGMVLGDGSMLHIEQSINSAIERYTSARWQNRIVAFYRYSG